MTLTTKLAVAMIALVAITVSAIGWLNYRSLEQALLPRVLDRIESQSRLVAADLDFALVHRHGKVIGTVSRRSALRGTLYRPALDGDGRLRVAAAVGINGDVASKATALAAEGVDVLVLADAREWEHEPFGGEVVDRDVRVVA